MACPSPAKYQGLLPDGGHCPLSMVFAFDKPLGVKHSVWHPAERTGRKRVLTLLLFLCPIVVQSPTWELPEDEATTCYPQLQA